MYFNLAIVLGASILSSAAALVMTNFLKFHINLILENKTTIEFLEKKGEAFDSPFNVGPLKNWR